MNYLATGTTYLIFGSLFIALGGFLTTKGWNELSNHSARQSLLSAAYRELEQNSVYLSDMDLAFEQLAKLEKTYLLPTFHFESIQTLQTSHLISTKEDDLLDFSSNHIYAIHPVNDSIRKLNGIFSGNAPISKKKETFTSFYQSPLFERFRRHHNRLKQKLSEIQK